MGKSIFKKISTKFTSIKTKPVQGDDPSFEELPSVTPQQDYPKAPVIVEEDEDLESDLEEIEDVKDLQEFEIPSHHDRMKGRESVSAEAYGIWNVPKSFVAPVYPKTESQIKRIKSAISEAFMFSSLDPEEIQTIIGAFQDFKAVPDQIIIHQGDDGDKLYLIETGKVEVYKTDKTTKEEHILCELLVGDIFGELALMYNAPRAATVKAKSETQLWALDRECFNKIVRDSTIKKREMYEDFLKEVSLLKDMDKYERSKIADALKKKMFDKDQVIINEGEIGETFYILIDGEAEAYKEAKSVMQYKKGDFFGELALLKNQPRAATVKAITPCTVVFLDRKSFKRLLGPLENILVRSVDNYRQTMQTLGLDVSYLNI